MNFEPLFQRPVHGPIAAVARYFQDLAPGDALPKRQDFRPTCVPSLLGYYFLIDVLPGENDYRFSLTGEHVSVLFGVNGTNKRLSEIGDEVLCARLRESYDAVVRTQSFHYVRGRYTWPDRSMEIERLLVPMGGHDGELSSILGVVIATKPTEHVEVFAGIGAAALQIDETITGKAPLSVS